MEGVDPADNNTAVVACNLQALWSEESGEGNGIARRPPPCYLAAAFRETNVCSRSCPRILTAVLRAEPLSGFIRCRSVAVSPTAISFAAGCALSANLHCSECKE